MATIKPQRKNPKHAGCGSPVKIIVKANQVGNIHGEFWICEKHGEDVEEIIYEI